MLAKLLFLSGPMTGFKDWNRVAFESASKSLRDHGYQVISVTELSDRFNTIFRIHELLTIHPEDSFQQASPSLSGIGAAVYYLVDGFAALPDGPEIHPDLAPSKGMAKERYLATAILHVPWLPVEEWLARDPARSHSALRPSPRPSSG